MRARLSLTLTLLALVLTSTVAWGQRFVRSFQTIEEMAAANTSIHSNAIVAGLRGGMFYVTNTTALTNDGTRIKSVVSGQSWHRVYKGAVDVEWFRADRTGAIDSAPYINAAITAATNTTPGLATPVGARIYVPEGLWRIDSPIRLVNGIDFHGASETVTLFKVAATNDAFVMNVNFVPTTGQTPTFTLGDFSVIGTNNTVGYGIWLSTNANVLAQYQGTIHNVKFYGMKHAIKSNGVLLSDVNNVTSWFADSDAFHFGSPFTASTFTDTFAVNSGGNGFYVENSSYISWINCGVDANEGSGYGITNGVSMSWLSSGAEGNWLHGYGLTNTLGVTLISPYIAVGTTGGGVPSSVDGIHIAGGASASITIENPVIQAQNANHTGYAINVTTSGGIYPDQVVIAGGQIPVLTAGRFNDVGNKITRLNNNLGVGVAVPTQQLDVRNSANVGGNVTAALNTVGLALRQIYIIPATAPTTNQINLLTSAGNRALDITYIGAGSGSAHSGIPVGEVGIGSPLGPLNFTTGDVMRWNVSANGHLVAASTSRIASGTGSPEGVVTAPLGSLYMRVDGGAGTCLYVKQSDSAGNTGWTAVTP